MNSSAKLPIDGFVDLQVNGYAGVDFNDDALNADTLHAVCLRLQRDGVALFLPTLITSSIETICRRASRLINLRDADSLASQMIPGLHIEGPFINANAGFIGAHPAAHARPANLDVAKRMLESANGEVSIITLAPEQDADCAVTCWLAEQNIIVAAGHTDASLDELNRAIESGLTMFTHLGNGCPGQLARHDNIIQRVLSLSDRLWISFICDGHHVPTVALGNYLHLVDPDRIIVVTDAIAAAGLGPGTYQLGDLAVEVTEDGAAWAPGRKHFAGAAVTMRRSSEVLHQHLGLSPETIRRYTCENPLRILRKRHTD